MQVARVLANRYELEVPLGRGATGEVWRGRDLATRKPVAVKILQLAGIEGSALVAETITRFRREGATLARLRHPNIVAALEAGRIANELFLIMELAEGMSLASMLEQRIANNLGLLPVPSVLRIAEQACAGLSAAHAAGVVHRDIKPSNLMVAAQLNTKIIDFGIARLLGDNSAKLTQHALGTPSYISPEQLQNMDVDGRADLYSLGCVLYEQLAGRPPFEAEVPSALLVMHMKQRAVPLDSIRSDLPVGLARLVDRLMEKDRSRRPDTAAQVLGFIAAIDTRTHRNPAEQEADRQTFAGESAPRPRSVAMPEADRSTSLAPSQRPGAAKGKHAADMSEADRSTSLAPSQPPGAAKREQAAKHRAQPSFIPRSAAPGPPVHGPRDTGGPAQGAQAQGAQAQRPDAARQDAPRPAAPRPASGQPETPRREAKMPPAQPLSSEAYQATEAMSPGHLLQGGEHPGHPYRPDQRPAGPFPQPAPSATSHRRRTGWWSALITRARRKRA
jgi:eukaryotic-like serine/threonine-protein kinase